VSLSGTHAVSNPDRRNARYEPAHRLAFLILTGLALSDLHSATDRGVSAFMLNMNTIFERFVSTLVANALAETRLKTSPQLSFKAVVIDESTSRAYSTIRPDLVITDTHSGAAVPVDIKYKLYATKKFASTDVYQLFTYAYALGGLAAEKVAGVIYAASSRVADTALLIKPMAGVTAAKIRDAGLDVVATLESLDGGCTEAVHAMVRELIGEITGLAVT